MKPNRIKLTGPAIKTRLEAEALAGELSHLIIQHRTLTNELDEHVLGMKKRYEEDLAKLTKGIAEKSAVLQDWAEASPSEFDGRKSLDMTHAVIGWRTGQPQLKTLSGWTWDRVLEKLKFLCWQPYIRTKEEVDKATLLAQRESLSADDLRQIGVRVLQEEAFFVEPKLTEPETRVVAEAKAA